MLMDCFSQAFIYFAFTYVRLYRTAVSESRRAKKAFLVFRKLTQTATMRSDSFLKIRNAASASPQRRICLSIKKVIKWLQ